MKKLLLAIAVLALSGCNATPEQWAAANASWQQHVQSQQQQRPAGPKKMLKGQWKRGLEQMCQYDDGSVLNVGVNLCPMSI